MRPAFVRGEKRDIGGYMANIIKLPERLKTIAGFIEDGAAVADIGTDHGLLPVFLAQNGLARSIIASDISMDSLDSARGLANKHGVSNLIAFSLGSGLTGLDASMADTIVIAGLGGETIAAIISSAPWTRVWDIRLILQPQSKSRELCEYLRETGYSLSGARLALDNGRLYVVMLVSGGAGVSGLEPELELLAMLMHCGDPLVGVYLDGLIAGARRRHEALRESGASGVLEAALRLSTYISMKEVYESTFSLAHF